MALDALFDAAKLRVQTRPQDLGARSALWQIFAARGDFSRARTQLDAMVAIDSSWSVEANACQSLLQAEALRQQVFAGERAPVCLGEPPPWFADLAAGLSRAVTPDGGAAAAALLVRAQQASPTCSGSINGQLFGWLCDGDARLGPCLELMVRGQYFWVPWPRVRAISTRPPTELRDRLWLHALVTLEDDNAIEAFLPARYPAPRDDAEHLGQITHWTPLEASLPASADAAEAFLGSGQKTLVSDVAEWGLLDIRELRLQAPSS
jgi:type VI secretion system protein ImpE